MSANLVRIAAENNIKYFLISFVDLFGVLRSKLVPARAIGEMQKEGAGFAGFAAWLDMTPAHPDMFSIPDPESLIQLPWKPEVAWLAGDLWMGGKEVEASPRVALKRQIARAAKKGHHMKTGVECEYFLVTPDGAAISDSNDTQEKPCYDQSALMRQYDVISEICDAMIELGWNPYQNDHEDANGQFEMNWDFDDALITADRHVFSSTWSKQLRRSTGCVRPSCPSRLRISLAMVVTPIYRFGTGRERRICFIALVIHWACPSWLTIFLEEFCTTRMHWQQYSILPLTVTSVSMRRLHCPERLGHPMPLRTGAITVRIWCVCPIKGDLSCA